MIEILAKILIAPIIFVAGLAGYSIPTNDIQFGVQLPQAVAVFETSLASPITSSATSLTLSANSVRGGGALSGYNCVTIDEGSAQAETVCGTISGTSMTSLQRGISQANGTTTVAALQFSHRRGANIKITDFPVIQLLKAQNNGEETFENAIRYATSVSTTTLATNDQNIASVAYANSLAFGAVPAASETASGFVEIGTALETASSTLTGGSGARLVIPARVATSTAPSSGHVIPVTGIADGNIAEGFLPTTLNQEYTFTATTTFTASTTSIGGINILDTAKNVQLITASTTWAVPAGIEKVYVELVGGGGGSHGCTTSSSCSGVGGSGGGYAAGTVDVSATTSIVITIGSGGAAGGTTSAGCTSGGTTSFSSYMSATGGTGCGAGGGTGTGGTINISGTSPAIAVVDPSICLSFGGQTPLSVMLVKAGHGNGDNGTGYGQGASAGCEVNNAGSTNGAAGLQGVVIIRY